MNEEWKGRQFVTRVDIKAPVIGLEEDQDAVFEKGTKVKVWVESAADWIRVKAYPAGETREETRGRTIIYIFSEDLKEKDRKSGRVQAILRNKFNQLLAEA